MAKAVENSENGVNGNGVNKKKTKELKVLDPKAAQNLSILLGGKFENWEHEFYYVLIDYYINETNRSTYILVNYRKFLSIHLGL